MTLERTEIRRRLEELAEPGYRDFNRKLLPGVEDMDAALHLKNKILSVRREDIHLPEGRYLNAELMGLAVRDTESGQEIGKITDILLYPANNVLVVKGEKEYMIPAVPAMIEDTNLDAGVMTVHLLKGMASDEN